MGRKSRVPATRRSQRSTPPEPSVSETHVASDPQAGGVEKQSQQSGRRTMKERFPYEKIRALPSFADPHPYVYRPVIPITIFGATLLFEATGLLDTGSAETILPSAFFTDGLVDPDFSSHERHEGRHRPRRRRRIRAGPRFHRRPHQRVRGLRRRPAPDRVGGDRDRHVA